ncbi:MAG: hypothetical protein WDN30_14145 [Pararobbsia sp.]
MPSFDEDSNTIVDKNGDYWRVQPAGAPGTSANLPHPSQVAADAAVQNIARANGMDASGLVPDPTPVPPARPTPPTAESLNAAPESVPDAAPAPAAAPAQPAAAPTAEPALDPQPPASGAPGDKDVLEFAQQRLEALSTKQSGGVETTMTPSGQEDVEVPGQQLSPTEQMEWAALHQFGNDPAAIARFYGFDGPSEPAPGAPSADEVNEAAHTAATSPNNDIPEPTQAQKEAGNYQKGHVDVQGLDRIYRESAGVDAQRHGC